MSVDFLIIQMLSNEENNPFKTHLNNTMLVATPLPDLSDPLVQQMQAQGVYSPQ